MLGIPCCNFASKPVVHISRLLSRNTWPHELEWAATTCMPFKMIDHVLQLMHTLNSHVRSTWHINLNGFGVVAPERPDTVTSFRELR
jgi:hypothetical protein